MLKASVTIATWNRRELLVQVVEALANQTIPSTDYEVIVCDSDSSDGTKDAILALAIKYKNVRYLNASRNVLAVKRNEGIRAAAADIVIFMDDDAVPDMQFVESHVRAHQERDGVVFCGQIRYPEEWLRRSNYFRYRDSRHLGPNRPDMLASRLPPWMITVMNLSFKRSELLTQAGFVSEEFTRYGGEDTEFGFRVVRAGMQLIYLPQARVVHFEFNGSIKQFYRKLYVASRYSTPVIYRLAPEFFEATSGRFIERIYAEKGIYARGAKLAARILTHRSAVYLVIKYLERTDKLPRLYLPFLFRYLSAIAFAAGIRDRSYAPGTSQSHGAWFE